MLLTSTATGHESPHTCLTRVDPHTNLTSRLLTDVLQSQKALNDSTLKTRCRKHTNIFQLHRLKKTKKEKLPVALGVFTLGGKTKWYSPWTECSHKNTRRRTGEVASHYTNSAAYWPIGWHASVWSGWATPALPGARPGLCTAFLLVTEDHKQARRRIWSVSHLCFLTAMDWAGWLPWLLSPDILVGPPSALGWQRRGASVPSSSSQDWLATERKALTESSESESAGGERRREPGRRPAPVPALLGRTLPLQ